MKALFTETSLYKSYRLTLGAIFFFFFTFPGFLQSEVVYLRNKTTLEGSISGQTGTSVEVRTPRGVQHILKKDILRIRYVPLSEAEKAAIATRIQKRKEAQRLQREKLELELEKQKEEKARLEQERKIKELEESILAVKKQEAKERAERAAALRELVDKGQMEKPEDEPISYMDFAWRSIVLPGWGHFYLDRPVVGSFYAGGSAFLLLNAYQKRERAVDMIDTNQKEVLRNAILTVNPNLAPLAIRTAYSIEANRKAFTEYQKAIDEYNYSLYLLEVFYAVQLLHIVYNGIAWEEGLFIVNQEKGDSAVEFHMSLGAVPPTRGDRKTAIAGSFRIDYRL